jgi:hypothetical protein
MTEYVRKNYLPLILACVFLLSLLMVSYQIKFMTLEWYETTQWERTVRVIEGKSGTPWQYRLFTEGSVYLTVKVFEAVGVPRPIGVAFVLIRLLQNTLAFTLAVLFYRKLGMTVMEGLLGVSLLAFGMCHGLYDGDLTFNTYTDISIFLTAGLLILNGRFGWLIPLMLIAPFNRETSGCIPFMLLFSQLQLRPRLHVPKRVLIIFGVCLGLWMLFVGGMRLPFIFGVRDYIIPTSGKSPGGGALLLSNLTWWRTWVFLFATVGLMPLLALVSWKGWPEGLKRFFWAVVPVWFPIHFACAHAAETRLFLVPQVLIFMPGALLGIKYWRDTTSRKR